MHASYESDSYPAPTSSYTRATMRLRHIEVFQAVMETGSMSAAARLIHLTQSAVSRSVANAELQLGYPLFHRVGGRLVPTTEGLALFEESSAIFERLESLKRTAHNLKSGEQGLLRIAAIPAVCHKLLTDDDPLYMAFLRYCEHQGFRPTGRLLVQTSQLAEELVAREIGWTVVDFRTAAMRRKDVVVTPLQPYVECSMNAFFAKNHSPT